MRAVRIGESAITGRVQGKYNRETGTGEIKRGTTSNGNRYQIFEISVSTKNQDGTWVNGQPIPVMMFGDKKVDAGDNIGLVGRFGANNWTNKDGKKMRGLQFTGNADDLFEPSAWEPKGDTEGKQEAQEEVPW